MKLFKEILFEAIANIDSSGTGKNNRFVSIGDRTALKGMGEVSERQSPITDFKFRSTYDTEKRKFLIWFEESGVHNLVHQEHMSTKPPIKFFINTKSKNVEVIDDEGFLGDISFKGPKQDQWIKDIKKYFRGFRLLGDGFDFPLR